MKTASLILSIVAIASVLFVEVSKANDNTLQQTVVSKEREELEAVKAGDMQTFASLIADDAVFLNSRGPGTKAIVVQNTTNFHLLEFSMEDIRFVPISDKSGLVAYKLTEKASSNGKEFTVQIYASAVWAERGGKWVCLFSQETPARH